MEDKKAREAIMQLANALYGTMLSMDFIKYLADELFTPKKTKRKKKSHDKTKGE